MLHKEDWIILVVVILSVAASIYFHVRPNTIQNALTLPPKVKTYSTPAPSKEIEIKFQQKKRP